ncbi:hypothetical protein [Endozoicomonas sp. Mp262]|uniref:tetratricopeptide repeat protein n=1 Tax=Endozoicomonas sp. Mp262 TaxID=2919499 RepID=UPI0021D88EC7
MIKTLADIGFMASSSGQTKHAFAIFTGIEAVKPDSILPDIGYALEFMNKKKYQEAISILTKQALQKEPDSAAAKAFIGLALMLDGHNKKSEDCLEAIKNSDDSAASKMAKELLDHIRSN